MALTAQPEHSEPQRATMVLSTRTDVAEPVSPTYLRGLASSTIVDLGNSSSSMLSLTIFHGKLESMKNKTREVIKNLY